MPATVTSNFRIANARNFADSFEEYANGGRDTITGRSYVYLFIGKILSWDKTHAGFSDTVIPTPDGDVQGNEFEPWRDMISATRVIANTDIAFGARRYNWSSGVVYTPYDDQDPAITSGTAEFYVYEGDAGAVFKCLDNNGGVPSTDKPSVPNQGVISIPFTGTDGYRWKYMFTIPAGQTSKFLTTNYIPVRTLNAVTSPSGESELTDPAALAPGYTDQATVQLNANNGAIETYVIISGGSGFTAHSGGISTKTISTDFSPNGTFFALSTSSGLSLTGDFYNGAAIFVSNNTHQLGIAIIEDYGTLGTGGGSTQDRAVLLNPGFAAAYVPLEGDAYSIAPRIEVIGDGFDANAYAIMTDSGSVSQINTWTSGNTYTTANVVAVGGTGSGLQTRAVISPPGGHGFDPVGELNGYNLIISKTLVGAGDDNAVTGTGNNFPISNEYRNVGLVRNAYLRDGYDADVLAPAASGANWYANSSPLHQTVWIVANTTNHASSAPFDWTPTGDDEVKGGLSGATGRVVEYNSDSRAIISLTNVVANSSGLGFMESERIGKLRNKAGVTSDPTLTYVTANGYVEDGGASQIAHDDNSTVIYLNDLEPYTGEILYIENRTPITRSSDQSEDIKIVIEF